MGQGGKGVKPGGNSKRVGRGRNKGKKPLNSHYFAIEKGLKRKRHEKRAGAGNARYGGRKVCTPCSPSLVFQRDPMLP